jgi:hypothetical protein
MLEIGVIACIFCMRPMRYRVYLLFEMYALSRVEALSKLLVANTVSVRRSGCSLAPCQREFLVPDQRGDTHILVYTLSLTEVAYTFVEYKFIK